MSKLNSLNTAEKLKSRKIIGSLFSDGKVIGAYPIKFFWIATELKSDKPVQFAFSVPKRKFKKAVDRNKVKRLMREAVRLNKQALYEKLESKQQQLAIMVLYSGDKISDFATIENKVIKCYNKLNLNLDEIF